MAKGLDTHDDELKSGQGSTLSSGENSFSIERSGNQAFSANFVVHQIRLRKELIAEKLADGGLLNGKRHWSQYFQAIQDTATTSERWYTRFFSNAGAPFAAFSGMVAFGAQSVREKAMRMAENAKKYFEDMSSTDDSASPDDTYSRWAEEKKNTLGTLPQTSLDNDVELPFGVSCSFNNVRAIINPPENPLEEDLSLTYTRASLGLLPNFALARDNLQNSTSLTPMHTPSALAFAVDKSDQETANPSLSAEHSYALALPCPESGLSSLADNDSAPDLVAAGPAIQTTLPDWALPVAANG